MNSRIQYLYQRYIGDNCTEAEREEFFFLLGDEAAGGEPLNELLDQTWNQLDVYPGYEREQADRILNQILIAHPKSVVRKLNWYRYAAAAAAVLVLGISVYWYTKPATSNKQAEFAQAIIGPGKNKAVLTLGNGAVINLDESANGEIAKQAGIVITKTADGQLVYDATGALAQAGKTINSAVFNTISTPKGGQYQINLPDGTKVWLNAASSLKYPAVFTGAERRVELTGEAYFEVAKVYTSLQGQKKRQPFLVKSNVNGVDQEIEVLGTHFNINAYNDEEAIRTTLLEGSVRVSALPLGNQSSLRGGTTKQSQTGNEIASSRNASRNDGLRNEGLRNDGVKGASEVLRPGQQSVLDNSGGNGKTNYTIKVAEVDTEEAVAWKTGFFQFNEAALPNIMRQLSRWYNVDVVFEGKPSSDLFHFKIPKNLSLNEVLRIFETNGINLKIEGRKLIVKS